MHHEFSTPETPVFSSILRQLNDRNILTARHVGDLLNLADAYPRLSSRDSSYSDVRTIFRHAPAGVKERVQRAILENLADGEGWLFERIDGVRDLSGDGVIDTNDVLDGGISALDQVSRLLTLARKESANGTHRFAPGRADALRTALNQAITHLLEVQQVVAFLDQHQTRRSA